MGTTRNYFTHKSKYISYGYCLRDLGVCDRQHAHLDLINTARKYKQQGSARTVRVA